MSLEKAKEYFDLSVSEKGDDYVIVGVPKETNKFLGKMEIEMDYMNVKVNMGIGDGEFKVN